MNHSFVIRDFEYLQALRDDYFLIILKLCMKMLHNKCISAIEELVTHKIHCCGNLPIHLLLRKWTL